MGSAVATRAPCAIERVRCALYRVPLAEPVSDAKVHSRRQLPLASVDVLVAHLTTADGLEGIGFSYSKRAGGPALFAHAKQLAPLLVGEDALAIGGIWEKLVWAAASIGREGLAVQTVAAFDIALHDRRAKQAGLPLATMLGRYRDSVRCYDTGGGFLSATSAELIANAERSLALGVGGIKVKVGGDPREDVSRVAAVRGAIGEDTPLMADANQQWDRAAARRVGRRLERYDLTWLEEPLDAYDAAGHAALRQALDTPIASGEMLSTTRDLHRLLVEHAVDVLQPDVVRVGGVSPYLRIATIAAEYGVMVAPHFATELHIHLAAAQPAEGWVEYFDWLAPLFEERLEIAGGRIQVPDRPGLGLTLSPRADTWLQASAALPDGAA